MKKLFLFTMMVLLMMTGIAQATLTTIGTATYNDGTGAKDYNLIWDDDNNGKSLVWLDYSNYYGSWQVQMDWASGLESALTINLYEGYSVTWEETTSWRLPLMDRIVGGFHITSSEMGHLYYEELGNLGQQDAAGNYRPDGSYGLKNTGDFKNLNASGYWSGMLFTNDPSYAWKFRMDTGLQYKRIKAFDDYGLAVRSGEVSLIPVPGAIILLGAGLLWIVGLGRKSRRDI